MSDTVYELVYFGIRGRPEPVRLLLSYVGAAWNDTAVSNWPSVKPTTPLGQLPMLIERKAGAVRQIPQSAAMLRHLGRVFDLYGVTEDDHLACDIAMETALDLAAAINPLAFGPNKGKDPAALNRYLDEVAQIHLARLARLLGDQSYFVGASPTVADFSVFNALDVHLTVEPALLAPWPTLAAFHARVAGLATVSAYLEKRRPSEFAPLATVRATGQPLV